MKISLSWQFIAVFVITWLGISLVGHVDHYQEHLTGWATLAILLYVYVTRIKPTKESNKG